MEPVQENLLQERTDLSIILLTYDSGRKNRWCQSVFQKYSTLLVFTSVTHARLLASQPASR